MARRLVRPACSILEGEGISSSGESGRLRRVRTPAAKAGRHLSNRVVAMVILVILVASVIFSAEYIQIDEQDPIRIGVILSLTGPQAASAVDVERTLLIAIDEINAMNKLNGRRMELIIRDCMSDTEKAKEVYAEIEQEYHPLMYISALSSISIALSPLAEENRTPLIAVVCASDTVTAGRDWAFRYYSGARDEVEPVLVKIDSSDIKSLGVLHLDDEYGNAVLDALKPEIEIRDLPLKIEKFESGTTDFTTQVQNLSDTDAIFAAGLTNNYEGILAHLRDAGYAGKIFLASGASSPSVRNLPTADGAFVSAPNIYRPSYSYSEELESAFKAEYNMSLSHQGVSGYDALNMVAGLLIDEVVSRENLRSLLLRGVVYSGVLGVIIVEPGQHNFGVPLFAAQIIGGVLVYR